MFDRVDCVVVGAGVVGLATARALALRGREVLVLEAENAIGTGIRSRNSEVIHAGIYYPTGSLKALLCMQGQRMLYAYCAERGVPHQRCGKLVVATSVACHTPLLHAQYTLDGIVLTMQDGTRLRASTVSTLRGWMHRAWHGNLPDSIRAMYRKIFMPRAATSHSTVKHLFRISSARCQGHPIRPDWVSI